MLSLVGQPRPDRLSDARELLWLVEFWRPNWAVVGILLPLFLAVCLFAAGSSEVAGLCLGASLSLALSRYGPRRWPGKR